MSSVKQSRSVTFRLPESLYERLEAVAFANLQDSIGEDVQVAQVNISVALRDHLARHIEQKELLVEGGAEVLAERFRQAKIASIQSQLDAIQLDHST